MTDSTHGRRVVEGELLPPTPRAVSLAPEVAHLPQGMLGISLFARARYASEQKQFEAYTRLVSAKNGLLRELQEQQRLLVEFAVQAERAQNLDDLRDIERQKIRNELAAIRREGEISNLRHETEVERLQFERDRYRKARMDLHPPPSSPPPKPKPQPTMAESFRDVGKEIEEVERAFEELRTAAIREAGGEEHLSPAVRDRLRQFELLRDQLINEAMGALL